MQVMKFIWNMQKISILILMQISNFRLLKLKFRLLYAKKCCYIITSCILWLFWVILFTQHNFSPRQQLVRHPTLPRQYRRRSLRPRQMGTSPQPRDA